jgi:hypothetical protein
MRLNKLLLVFLDGTTSTTHGKDARMIWRHLESKGFFGTIKVHGDASIRETMNATMIVRTKEFWVKDDLWIEGDEE